jgi:hypothetical protein
MVLAQQPIIISWPPNLLRSVSSSLTAYVPAVFHTQIFEPPSYLKWNKAHSSGILGKGSHSGDVCSPASAVCGIVDVCCPNWMDEIEWLFLVRKGYDEWGRMWLALVAKEERS